MIEVSNLRLSTISRCVAIRPKSWFSAISMNIVVSIEVSKHNYITQSIINVFRTSCPSHRTTIFLAIFYIYFEHSIIEFQLNLIISSTSTLHLESRLTWNASMENIACLNDLVGIRLTENVSFSSVTSGEVSRRYEMNGKQWIGTVLFSSQYLVYKMVTKEDTHK